MQKSTGKVAGILLACLLSFFIPNTIIDTLGDASIDNNLGNGIQLIENNDVEITTFGFNLFDMEQKKTPKKSAISVYFEEEDLMLLKAISKLKNTTVNKTVAKALEDTIKITKANLPAGFDVAKMAKKYDLKNKDKGNKSGSNKDNHEE